MCFYFLFFFFADFKIKFHAIYHLQMPNTLTSNNNDTDCESVLFIISFFSLSNFRIVMFFFFLLVCYWNHRILNIHFYTECEVWTSKTPNDVHSVNARNEFKQSSDATIGNMVFSITKCTNVVIKKILLFVCGFRGVDVIVLFQIITNIFKPNDHITRTHRR